MKGRKYIASVLHVGSLVFLKHWIWYELDKQKRKRKKREDKWKGEETWNLIGGRD